MVFQDYVQAWQSATNDFLAAVKAIPVDQQRLAGVCGIWSSKELIAHLAGWNREALRRYKDYQHGDTNDITYEEDSFNAQSVAALKLFNWRETLETYQQTVEDLLEQANALTPEQLASDRRYQIWLRALSKDLREHTTQVRQWLAAQGGT